MYHLSNMNSDLFSKDWRTEKPTTAIKHQQLVAKARREVDLADHLVYVTMPLTEDMKFILAVSEHIYLSASLAVEAMLEQYRYFKKIEAFPRNFIAMVDLWTREVQVKCNFERKYADFLRRVQEVKHAMDTSSMRFKRRDKYILTSDVYDLKVLDLETVKKYLLVAKDFIDKSEEVIKEEDERQSVLREENE